LAAGTLGFEWDEDLDNGFRPAGLVELSWIMRTLKEQCLYLRRFQSLTEAHRIIGEFLTRYNSQ
jgi:hypothetical protein